MTPQDQFRQALDELKRQPELLVRSWASYTPAQQQQIGPQIAAIVDQIGSVIGNHLDAQAEFRAAQLERLARLEASFNPQGIPPAAILETRSMPSTIESVNVSQREIGIRIMPWDKVGETAEGPETFRRGAFAGTLVEEVRLRMDHQDPPTGKGIRYWEDERYGYMSFRLANTARANEQMELARSGVSPGASIGFVRLAGGTAYGPRTADGRPLIVRSRVQLKEVSTTWNPVYADAGVMYLRARDQ